MADLPPTNPIPNVADKIEGSSQSVKEKPKQTLPKTNQEAKENLELTLPKERGFLFPAVFFYQGFWCPSRILHNVITFQQHFEAHDTDIILATKPKSGTTWLKSLVYSILNRTRFTETDHPLLTKSPHELAPFFEFNVYSEKNEGVPDLSNINPPRLFSTHLPYRALPESIKGSKCRIVYIGRNPYDTVVSAWKFLTGHNPELHFEVTIEDYLGHFLRGVEEFGPHWEHVLGYWKESLDRPNKFLFIKYEDMKENGTREMKRLAEFLGCGFSQEEETDGVIERILKLCSLSNLKELEVNKTGKCTPVENKLFFRKGEVGDWVNHLNPSMVERIDQMVKEKFEGSGLEFKRHS